jgi:hypothetical protein
MPFSSPYYTYCTPIIVGCKLYLDSSLTIYAPAGYYSNGDIVYQVTGSLGTVTSVSNCPELTPCPQKDCCFVGNTMI